MPMVWMGVENMAYDPYKLLRLIDTLADRFLEHGVTQERDVAEGIARRWVTK